MSTIAKRRADRISQQKSRGGGSIKTELENAYLMLAWEAEQLSEGQVASILGTDRLSVRLMREGAIARALQVAEGLANGGSDERD